MKTTIYQNFPTLADAFEWVTFKMLDAQVSQINTRFIHNEMLCVRGEDENNIYIGIYEI